MDPTHQPQQKHGLNWTYLWSYTAISGSPSDLTPEKPISLLELDSQTSAVRLRGIWSTASSRTVWVYLWVYLWFYHVLPLVLPFGSTFGSTFGSNCFWIQKLGLVSSWCSWFGTTL